METVDATIPRVTHKELVDVLKLNFELKRPTFVWGPIGIGKTVSVYTLGEMINAAVRVVIASQLEPSDVRGIPFPDEEKKMCKWLISNILPQKGDNDGKPIILFFDEFNHADTSVQKPFFQLLDTGRIGDEYKLPENVFIVLAGNTASDRTDISFLAGPMRDRVDHVTLVPADEEQFEKYCLEKEFEPEIPTFIHFRPERLHNFHENPDATVFATHRSWEWIDKKLKLFKNNKITENILIASIGSTIGIGVAREFIAFQKLQKKIDLNKLFKKPVLVKEIQKVDEKYALISAVASRYKTKRKDLKNILAICNELDGEFGIRLARMLKDGNKYFKADFKMLSRKKDKAILGFIHKFWKYLTDEELGDENGSTNKTN